MRFPVVCFFSPEEKVHLCEGPTGGTPPGHWWLQIRSSVLISKVNIHK